jgi:hypothetical protein
VNCERKNGLGLQLPQNSFHFSHGTCRTMAALELLRIIPNDGNDMTRAQWLLLGAIGLGLAIVVYVVFFCPADCQ